MKYVDGFVLVVKKGKLKEYTKMAKEAGEVWKKYGALEYFECIGDDLNPKMGGMKALMFPKMTKAKKDETILFSFIIYKSKQHRNQVNAKVMKEMRKHAEECKDSFKNIMDMNKFAYGGFKTIVEERK
ncbi:RNA signal recognition particle [Candidatus Woesearchaeota archaeon CG10_big_fil_rev_8_21_14_0_10_37_12]|nr:MAG: RNA signal recognition particle [Candidatus Woesearchaeota archaeon CG10_big_fil_rev_8_21_14_0_10_37_12]